MHCQHMHGFTQCCVEAKGLACKSRQWPRSQHVQVASVENLHTCSATNCTLLLCFADMDVLFCFPKSMKIIVCAGWDTKKQPDWPKVHLQIRASYLPHIHSWHATYPETKCKSEGVAIKNLQFKFSTATRSVWKLAHPDMSHRCKPMPGRGWSSHLQTDLQINQWSFLYDTGVQLYSQEISKRGRGYEVLPLNRKSQYLCTSTTELL